MSLASMLRCSSSSSVLQMCRIMRHRDRLKKHQAHVTDKLGKSMQAECMQAGMQLRVSYSHSSWVP